MACFTWESNVYRQNRFLIAHCTTVTRNYKISLKFPLLHRNKGRDFPQWSKSPAGHLMNVIIASWKFLGERSPIQELKLKHVSDVIWNPHKFPERVKTIFALKFCHQIWQKEVDKTGNASDENLVETVAAPNVLYLKHINPNFGVPVRVFVGQEAHNRLVLNQWII